ncbi:winged helix-turn-helix transcriptional regulator [Clostridium sp. OF09-36]|uniref:winged helix-turn-helix transcriptional regulator n=1 Tax=Clostridium sp. OF09-36 TaxID=2292310 RepID=UPI001FAAA7A6|nr:winged helix-turn-helix transcriptional regulator [Clostridium sp. OF09-36]
MIQRIQYNEMPIRVEYSLTEKGRDLLPVFLCYLSVGHEIYTVTPNIMTPF